MSNRLTAAAGAATVLAVSVASGCSSSAGVAAAEDRGASARAETWIGPNSYLLYEVDGIEARGALG